MNRERIERARASAKTWAEKGKAEMGDELTGPATIWEAYMAATFFSESRVVELCDALLAEESSALPVCVRCGRTIPKGEMMNYGMYGRMGGDLVTGLAHMGDCPMPLEPWIA